VEPTSRAPLGTILVALGALLVVAAIVVALLQSEISERTFYTGEVYLWSAGIAFVGLVVAAIGKRYSRPEGASGFVGSLTIGLGAAIVVSVVLVFAWLMIWFWRAYG
jgi:hypothetical protein